MSRLNFSIEENYRAAPVARTPRRDGRLNGQFDMTAGANERKRRFAIFDPLFITLAVAMLVMAAGAALLATSVPVHFLP